MDVNWTTFLFETINFLVLVWIVWRFLYRPIRNVVEVRRRKIENDIANASAMRDEAEATKERYEARLTDWEKEKSDLRRAFDEELDRERVQRLDRLNETLEEEREKARVLEDRRISDIVREAESRAMTQGAQFASSFLSKVASAELEMRLVRILLDEFPSMTPEQLQGIRAAIGEGRTEVTVTSAYEIDKAQRDELERCVTTLLGDGLTFRYGRDRELIAGIRIGIGPIIWGANVKDELGLFAEAGHDGS